MTQLSVSGAVPAQLNRGTAPFLFAKFTNLLKIHRSAYIAMEKCEETAETDNNKDGR